MKDIKLKYFQLNYSRTYFKDKNQSIIAVVCKKKKKSLNPSCLELKKSIRLKHPETVLLDWTAL